MQSDAVPLKHPCCGRHVVAVLISLSGDVFVGSNGVDNPQTKCPRKIYGKKRGEGWELCRDVCRQVYHAETEVLAKAGSAARGARVYILGHDCACDACHRAMEKAGVAWYLPVPGVAVDKSRKVVFPHWQDSPFGSDWFLRHLLKGEQ